MKKLLFIFLVASQALFAQSSEEIDTYIGVVEDGKKGVLATFTVVKSVKKDSVIFSYVILHDQDDTTMYNLKYTVDKCCKIIHYNGDDYIVSDSLELNDEYIYVYDFSYPDKEVIEGFFCVSPTFGLISVGDFTRADYMKFDGYARFDALIEPYRKRRAATD